MTAELILLHLAVCLYLAGTVVALAGVAIRAPSPRQLLPRLLWVALAAHMAALVVRSVQAGHLAVTSVDEALSFVAALVVGVFLLVQLRWQLAALGAVICPLALGLTLAAIVVFQGARPLPPVLQSPWLPVHILFIFLSDAVFALAFGASLLYLIQERRLKDRPARGLWRNLPSLEALDRLSYASVVAGSVLLTAGLVAGIIWAHSAWHGFWSTNPKLVSSVLVWVVYLTLVQGRFTAGWRGRRAARLTIASFAILVGVNAIALGNVEAS